MQECDAEPAAKRQALAAVVTARSEPRSAYLEWRDRKLEESTNWLDYLQVVNEDAYHVLLRHFVCAQITGNDCYLRDLRSRYYQRNPYDDHNHPCVRPWAFSCGYSWKGHDINICGMKYSTDVFHSVEINDHGTKMTNNALVAAAEANGIKAYKSWTKARLWKALMSVARAPK
jgi:hypothetical protein